MPIFYPDILENNNSDYPLVDATFLKGNAYPLAELADTGSIPTNKRRIGLIVFTSGSQEWYGYKGQDVSGWDTPSNWEQIGAGGGGSTDYISNVAYDTGSISFTGVGSAFDGVISINDLTSSLVNNDQTSSFVTNDDTGSFYYSSSVELNTITFYQGDGTTESVTVDTGSSVDISALNLHTGSINTFTGSIQTEVDNLTAATSSYLTGEDTGSFLYSGSYNSSTNELRLYSADQDYSLDLSGLSGGGGSGLAITASDEGVVKTENARSFDFVGNGVVATNAGNAVTVTINTGSADYISNVAYDTGSISFTGVGSAFDGVVNINDLTSSLINNNQTSSMAVGSAINTFITVKNKHTGTIAKGMPCYITGSGTSGNVVGVVPADAVDSTYMPAGVVLAQELTNPGDEGIGYINGFINGVDTSAFEAGDDIYVAVGGGYTNIKPTGSALIQKLGNVEKVHASNGSGVIVGAGRANDLPNINPGHFWVGDNDWVPQAVSTGSFLTADDTGSFLYSGSYNGDTSAITLYSIDQNYTLDLSGLSGGGGSGLAITASDEGVVKTENARSFDFVGNGVVATNSGNAVTVNITQVDTGSLLTTGSVNLNTLTFTKGDGSTFNITVDTGSSVDISALNLHTSSINTFTGSIQTEVDNLTAATSSYLTADDTGSFYYSSSVDLNTITFFQGDGTTESVTVDTGSATDISALNLHTGSINTFTGSIQTEVDNLTAATSSYVTNDDTGSFYYSSSVDLNTITFFQGDGTTESVTVDTGSAPGNDTEVIYNKNGKFHATGSFTFNDNGVLGAQELIINGAKVNKHAVLKVSGSDNSYFNIGESLVFSTISGNYTSINHHGLGSGNTLSWETDDNNEGPQWVLGVLGPNQNQTRGSNFTIIPGYTNDRDALFRVYRTPSSNNEIETFSVSSSGQIYMPDLENTTTPNIVGYDITTGELTYYSTASFGSGGGGSTDTGSLLLTGSVSNNVLTFTKGDGSTFNLTVDTGSDTSLANTDQTLTDNRVVELNGNNLSFNVNTGETFKISGSVFSEILITDLPNTETPVVLGYDTTSGQLSYYSTASFGSGGGSTDTGSLLTTGSISNTTLTFTKGDGTTFDLTVTGSNIYNTDGTLTGDRTVIAGAGADGNSLTFEFQNANFVINSDPARQVQINNLDTVDTPRVVGYADGVLTAMPTSSFKPGGTNTQVQYNNGGSFGGSSIRFDDVNSTVGINVTPYSNRAFAVSSSAGIAMRLQSDQATANRIQFVNASSVGFGVVAGAVNGDDFHLQQTDTNLQTNLYISASGEVFAPRLKIKPSSNILYYDDSTGEILYNRNTIRNVTAPTGSVQYATSGQSATTSSFVTVAGTIRTDAGETSHASSVIPQLYGKTLGTDAFITATWAHPEEASNQEQFCVLGSISGSGQLVVETSTVTTGRNDAIIFQGVVLV
jgi:hypothetical protein